jgi:hypothetical protein
MADYQVFNQSARKGFPSTLSDEHQRRWSDKRWQVDQSSQKSLIDRSRAHLNYEIIRGGKIVPLGTAPSGPERLRQRLIEADAEDPNDGLDEPKFRTVCEMVISGSRDRIREMAFGDQNVVFKKDGGNENVKRMPDIEKWSLDIYNAVAEKYGEENIVGFAVHLDETSPHIHCCVTPIAYDERKKRNRIKYRDTFGGGRDVLNSLHDFFAKVNEKWGLERGIPVSVTHNRHKTREEYFTELAHANRELEHQKTSLKSELDALNLEIKQKEKAIKGLQTMIDNLTSEKANLVTEIDSVNEQLLSNKGNNAELEAKLKSLKNQLMTVEAKIDDKKQKRLSCDAELSRLRSQSDSLKTEVAALRSTEKMLSENIKSNATLYCKAAIFDDILDMGARMYQSLDRASIDRLGIEDSFFDDKSYYRWNDVLSSGVNGFLAYIDGATTIAENASGGGQSSNSPWNDKDKMMDEARNSMFRAHSSRSPYRRKKGGMGY